MTLNNRFLPISLFAILWLRADEHDIFLPSRWLTLCLFLLEICSWIMHWILYGEVVWHGFLVLPCQRYASVLFFIIFFSIFHTFSTRAPCLRMSYYLSWGLLFKFSTIPWVHYQTNFIVWLIQRTVFCQKKTVKELWYLVTLDDFFHWFHLLCCMSRLCTLWYWEDSDVGVKTFFNKMVISW